MLVFMSFMLEMAFIVKWCPVSIDDTRLNHMCDVIYDCCVYSCIDVSKGGQFAYVSVSW